MHQPQGPRAVGYPFLWIDNCAQSISLERPKGRCRQAPPKESRAFGTRHHAELPIEGTAPEGITDRIIWLDTARQSSATKSVVATRRNSFVNVSDPSLIALRRQSAAVRAAEPDFTDWVRVIHTHPLRPRSLTHVRRNRTLFL